MNTVATELLPLSAEDFATLEAWLSARRTSFPETPDWEFCEGFLAALVCCRRAIAPSEYWPRLLGLAADVVPANVSSLWARRWALVEQALDTRVSALDDPAAYQPELGESADSFAQRWAQGFMAAVVAWPDEWAGPRNAQAQQWREAALKLLRALTLPDTGAPTLHAYEDQQGP
ncbi:MAG: YecA family protein, partial [Gammaproteobacteria bacterium]|nr:YecA family protein [Gammaproteobacteria bacterium]